MINRIKNTLTQTFSVVSEFLNSTENKADYGTRK